MGMLGQNATDQVTESLTKRVVGETMEKAVV